MDLQYAHRLGARDPDLDLTAGGGELHGVGNQVLQHLHQPVEVAEHRRQRCLGQRQLQPALSGRQPVVADDPSTDVAQVDRRTEDPQPSPSMNAIVSRSSTSWSSRVALRSMIASC